MVTAATKLRCLLLGRKATTNLDNIFKTRDITLPTKVHIVKAIVFIVVMLEKEMATHSSTLAWKIPGTVEPGRLQSMGLLGVGHDSATSLSLFTFMHWRRKWQPTPYSCLENPRDRGAWWAAVSGVAQSRTRLKHLSSSSSKDMRIGL